MKTIRISGVIALTFCLAVPRACAEDAKAVPDRDRIQLGEEVRLTISIPECRQQPLVEPPRVPGCKIEQDGPMKYRNTPRPIDNKNAKNPPRKVPNPGDAGLGDALNQFNKQIEEMERDLQKHGLGGAAPLLREQTDLLRRTRQEAMEALRGVGSGSGTVDFQVVYRVTPSRTGVLTMPPFVIREGGTTHITKPVELTVEASVMAQASAQPPEKSVSSIARPTAPELPPLYDASAVKRQDGLPAHFGQWLGIFLAVPILSMIFIAVGTRWRRVRKVTAAERQRHHAERTAERQLWDRLRHNDEPEIVAASLNSYLQLRCHLPVGEITPGEAEERLREAHSPSELIHRFVTLLETCSAARFAPGTVAIPNRALAKDATQLLEQLDRKARWNG